MSCCGKARAAASGAPSVSRRATTSNSTNRSIRFEYTGQTSLMVIGPVTGLRYHFAGHGAQARVDARDRSHLLGIAALRQV